MYNGFKFIVVCGRWIATLCFFVFSSFSVLAEQHNSTELLLSEAFLAVGYGEAEINGCNLIYMKRVDPDERNNGLFARVIHKDLNSFRDFSEIEIYNYDNGGAQIYLMDIEFDDAYYEKLREMHRFGSWVQENYPNANWPYEASGQLDQFAPILEFELNQTMSIVTELNRTVTFSKYGSVTFLDGMSTTIASTSRANLAALLDAISAHSTVHGCEIEN